MRLTLIALLALALSAGAALAQDVEPAAEEAAQIPAAAAAGQRVSDDLVALYRFDNVIGGRVIPDLTADIGGLDLIIQGAILGVPLETISVRDDGLRFGAVEEAQIPGVFSTEPATSIVEPVRASGQLTLEAWVTPAADNLTGPARIVSISRDSAERNITLGQNNDTYGLRLRTTGTNEQGTPDVFTEAGTLRVDEPQHVVVTFDGEMTAIYIDGEVAFRGNQHAGDLANWDETMCLVVGNEADGNRRWLGTVHLMAIYSYALSPAQVLTNFSAGL